MHRTKNRRTTGIHPRDHLLQTLAVDGQRRVHVNLDQPNVERVVDQEVESYSVRFNVRGGGRGGGAESSGEGGGIEGWR